MHLNRIAVKILSIALILIVLMCAVATVSVFMIRNVAAELTRIHGYYLGLERLAAAIDAHSLEYEIHVERLAGLYSARRPARSSIQKERRVMAIREKQIAREIKQARQLLSAERSHGRLDDLRKQRILIHLKEIDLADRAYIKHAHEYLNLIRKGRTARAAWTHRRLIQEEDRLDARLREFRTDLQDYIKGAVALAERHEQSVLLISIVLTGLATLVGLLMALAVTRGLVRPVLALVKGAHQVGGGDLDLQLPITSRDEIGTLTNSFNGMVQGLKQKEHIKDTFGKYVDPRIVEQLVQQESGGPAGVHREMTVFFSDIAGFTDISEQLTPDALVRLINAYLTKMSGPIHENAGVIDKFIGDAVMAYWGPPFVADDEHAARACFAALLQLSLLNQFRKEIPGLLGLNEGVGTFDIRIGIATGQVLIGNIGSDDSRGYTVMGDVVNLASRLEGINKQYGTRIILSQGTREGAGAAIEVRALDTIRVKGKTEPIAIFELLGRAGDVSDQRLALRDAFEQALTQYRQGEFKGARESFNRAASIAPDDRATRIFQERLQVFESTPPDAATWDGVWVYTTK